MNGGRPFVMPMPPSSMVRVLATLSALMRTLSESAGELPSLRVRKRLLSHASAALLTSSLRNTSLSWYSELMMISITRDTYRPCKKNFSDFI